MTAMNEEEIKMPSSDDIIEKLNVFSLMEERKLEFTFKN